MLKKIEEVKNSNESDEIKNSKISNFLIKTFKKIEEENNDDDSRNNRDDNDKKDDNAKKDDNVKILRQKMIERLMKYLRNIT